ncbi:MAG: hypothetical protein D6731_23890 [Planctomycetota bacterium]|nr:MAG: hypothetical protein D6731_23890 [Planctomycetota bacterium]
MAERSFLVLCGSWLGFALLAAAASAQLARTEAARWLGELPFVLGAALVVLTGLAFLVLRWAQVRWPLGTGAGLLQVPPWAPWASALGAGAGIGGYAGLTHGLSSPVHWGPFLAYFVFVPAFVLSLAVCERRLLWGFGQLGAFVLALEAGAQLGLRRGRWWGDVTGLDAAVLLVGAGALLVAAAFRRWMPRPVRGGGRAPGSATSPPGAAGAAKGDGG